MYDEFLGTGPMVVQNLHFGYWESADEPFEAATDRLSDMVIARSGVGAGDRVLDVGCGVGAPTLRVARATGAELVGINVSRRQLDCAEEAAAAAGLADRVGFAYADATRLEFEDSSFDAVYALESMIHMPTAGRSWNKSPGSCAQADASSSPPSSPGEMCRSGSPPAR